VNTQAAAARPRRPQNNHVTKNRFVDFTNEIASLGEQIELQKDLVSSIERDTVRAHQLADRGFLSKQDSRPARRRKLSATTNYRTFSSKRPPRLRRFAERKRELQVVKADLNVRFD